MRIQQLSVSGYRSLQKVSLELGPLSVFIGPNGSGKTNVLSTLELISATLRGQLLDTVLRQGGMSQIVWGREERSIDFSIRTDPVDPHLDRQENALSYHLRLTKVGETGTYQISAESLTSRYEYDKGLRSQPFKFAERTPSRVIMWSTEERGLRQVDQEPELLSGEESVIAQVRDAAQYPVAFAFRSFCSSWTFYRDFAVGPLSETRRAAITRPETRLLPDGSNLISVLHTLYTTDRVFKSDLDTALGSTFPDDYEELMFPPAEDGRVQMRWASRNFTAPLSALDLSDGTLRFMMLCAILIGPDPAPVVVIDEPELGLHPSMMATIADMMKEAAERTQIIVATHSPEFVNAFTDRPDCVVVFSKHDGATSAQRLRLEELKHWLTEYALGELWVRKELEDRS
ncbi:MAG: AAA family ATPase [Chloroflexi bacterium]|nr:AAA family ATPase [Chloroflexota bacterium]